MNHIPLGVPCPRTVHTYLHYFNHQTWKLPHPLQQVSYNTHFLQQVSAERKGLSFWSTCAKSKPSHSVKYKNYKLISLFSPWKKAELVKHSQFLEAPEHRTAAVLSPTFTGLVCRPCKNLTSCSWCFKLLRQAAIKKKPKTPLYLPQHTDLTRICIFRFRVLQMPLAIFRNSQINPANFSNFILTSPLIP